MKTYFLAALILFSFLAYGQKNNTPLTNPLRIDLQKKFSNLFKYDSVPNDPLKTRVYTLSNGFTVYLSVVKDQPKIQGFIVVKAGSKYDPSNATGLAHYLEHMLFKGTDKFGTVDYEKEKPYLDKIEELFEIYRNTKNESERRLIYRTIDSLSGIAAKYAIANEYDKMIAAIGGENSNAYTWFDQTVYFEQFPSNQAVNWLRIQSERFRNPIMRIFHTELETVYEEKNMSLDDDNDKVMEELFLNLFPNHTYGTQTTIGTIEHLKNPSIKEIKNFYKKYYVPNNMGLVLVGDFDPDQIIQNVALAFGSMVKVEVEQPVFKEEEEIKSPIIKNIYGPEAESVTVGYRFGGSNTTDPVYLQLIAELLSNQSAGIFDENLVNAQQVLVAMSYWYSFNDYSVLFLEGKNKENQKLEDVTSLMIKELNKLAAGDFSEEQLNAAKINLNLKLEKKFENIDSRGSIYVDALVKKQPWAIYWENLNKFKTITKQDLINFCKQKIRNNYVVVYKRLGNPDNVVKVTKPEITPVELNNSAKSEFFKSLESFVTKPIEPRFTDFSKAIIKQKCQNGQEIWQARNFTNSLFKFYIALPYGNYDEPLLNLAFDYLKLAGNQTKNANQLQKQLYSMGCSWQINIGKHQTFIELTGLSENFHQAIDLIYNWFTQPSENLTVFNNLVNDYIKKLQDLKTDKHFLLWNGLMGYAQYGPAFKNQIFVTTEKARNLKIEDLKSTLSKVFSSTATYLYYGKTDPGTVYKLVNNSFGKNPNSPYTPAVKATPLTINQHQVFYLNFDMNQADLLWVSSLPAFNSDFMAQATLYNEYFGGGMASLVFQVLRESKALAYSAKSLIQFPERKTDMMYNIAFMGTQADKLKEATSGMVELLTQMPQTQNAFEVARKVQIQKIVSSPLVRENLLLQHYKWSQQGIQEDFREGLYKYLNNADFNKLSVFQSKNIKPLNYNLLVVGDKNKLDLAFLKKFGPLQEIKPEDIFGN